MATHRINFLGASGCGTTTLGRAVAAALSIPHFECDDFYHLRTDPPCREQRDPHSRAALLEARLGESRSWVLSGGIAGLEPHPRVAFTLIVFLWIPPDLRMERLRARERAKFGERILPGGDMYADHEAFIEWAAGYDCGDIEGKTRARHEAYLAAQICPVLRIDGAITLETALATVLRNV
ncbi:MAG: adenylate kinase [Phycisphaerae bacterium]